MMTSPFWLGDALTFAKRASHDMRSPLGGVVTTSELLCELLEEKDVELVSLAKGIEGSANQALGLLKRLVGVLRATYGAAPPRQTVDTELVVDAVVERMEFLRRSAGARISVADGWPEMELVEEWLMELLVILADNAIRHGGKNIQIGHEREGDQLRIWVRDDGKGLSEKRRHDPFPAFEALHEKTHVTGLGLSIAGRLAALLGGVPRYTRLEGGITEFSVLLPMTRRAGEIANEAKNVHPPEPDQPKHAPKLVEPLEFELPAYEKEFDTLLALTRRLTGAPISLISILSDDEQVVTDGSGLEEVFGGDEGLQNGVQNCADLCMRVIEEGQDVVVENLTDPAGQAVKSFMGVPVRKINGQVAGCLSIADIKQRVWSEDDLAGLHDFALLAQKELRLREKRRRLSMALQRLREDEELNQGIVDNTTDCIKLLDASGKLLNMNGPGRSLMEVDDFASLKGLDWVEIWPESTRQLARNAMHEAQDGRTGRFQGLCPTMKGNWKWWDVVVTGVRGPDNKLGKLLSISRDITESKQAELAAKTREQSMRNVLDSILTVTGLLTPEGVMLEINAAALALGGVSLAEVAGRPFADGPWWQHNVEERTAIQRDIEQASGGKKVRRGATAWTFGGKIIEMDFSIVPIFDAQGEVTHLVPSGIDLTPRLDAERASLESERRFRLLADNMSQFAWITEANGDIIWYNQRWFDYTGTTLEEMCGWGWQAVHHPDHVERVVRKFKECLTTQTAWEDTFPLRGKDGKYRWFLSRAIPIRDESGVVVQWFGTNTDVTSQLETEQELRKASQAKDDFIAVLSHELRTPLNPALLISSAAAAREDLPEEVRHDFNVIRKNVEMEARLIDDLLDMTRILRGKLPLVVTTVSVESLMNETISVLCNEAEGKKITVECGLAARGLFLQGDEMRLRQVLWNVMRNSVKFTPSGGRIHIKTTASESQLSISVRDTGVGIAANEMARIFDPFTQGNHASGATSQRFGGLGLGLAISRLLVEQHGGVITARSDGPGCGTTVIITLPLSSAAPPSVIGSPDSKEDGPDAVAEEKPMRILLIEDHEATRETLAILLKRRGHEVVQAGCIADGHVAAHQGKYDLLMSDIGLPDGRGDDLLIRLRGEGFTAPAIALSGYGMESDLERSRDAGYGQHLTKPVSIGDLDRVLKRLRARC